MESPQSDDELEPLLSTDTNMNESEKSRKRRRTVENPASTEVEEWKISEEESIVEVRESHVQLTKEVEECLESENGKVTQNSSKKTDVQDATESAEPEKNLKDKEDSTFRNHSNKKYKYEKRQELYGKTLAGHPNDCTLKEVALSVRSPIHKRAVAAVFADPSLTSREAAEAMALNVTEGDDAAKERLQKDLYPNKELKLEKKVRKKTEVLACILSSIDDGESSLSEEEEGESSSMDVDLKKSKFYKTYQKYNRHRELQFASSHPSQVQKNKETTPKDISMDTESDEEFDIFSADIVPRNLYTNVTRAHYEECDETPPPPPPSTLSYIASLASQECKSEVDVHKRCDMSALIAMGVVTEELLTKMLMPLATAHVARCRDIMATSNKATHCITSRKKRKHRERKSFDYSSSMDLFTLPPVEAIASLVNDSYSEKYCKDVFFPSAFLSSPEKWLEEHGISKQSFNDNENLFRLFIPREGKEEQT